MTTLEAFYGAEQPPYCNTFEPESLDDRWPCCLFVGHKGPCEHKPRIGWAADPS